MFLQEIYRTMPDFVLRNTKNNCTYENFYYYWCNLLFERIMRLFVYEGLPEGLDQKEIEYRLHINGHCGITKFKGELTAFWGTFYGVTKYEDEWTDYNIHCPIYSGTRKIGKDIAIINNNALRNSTYALVHHYATMLAHNEVTIIHTLVGARDAGGVPVASTEKTKQSLSQYFSNLFNGKFGIVTDPSFMQVEFKGSDKHTQQNIHDLVIVRDKLLKSFYSDIGVRGSFEKRSNSVEAEVEADATLLALNLADMLENRKKGIESINSLYGTAISVDLAEEIKDSMERPEEREEFEDEKDSQTDV